MTKRDIASLVLKLTGVYILVRYLGYLPMVLGPLTMIEVGEPNAASTWLYAAVAVVPPAVYLVVCILIVVKSDSIAARLIPTDGDFKIGVALSKDDILTIAFCCIGLVVLVGSIPQLIQTGTSFAWAKRTPERYSESRHWIALASRLVANAIQVVIGLALFLQARGLAGLWHKLRDYKGLQES